MVQSDLHVGRTPERKKAILSGSIRYFTGRPCYRGHIAERNTKTGACMGCSRMHQKNYNQNNKNLIKERAKEFRTRNREILITKLKDYAKNNVEKEQARRKIYNKKNREKRNKYKADWYFKNKDRTIKYRKDRSELYSLYARNRRAKQKFSGGTHTLEQILELKKNQRRKCALCKKSLNNYHIDHIIPIYLGGSNYIKNIQILCPSCNLRKNKKDPINFAQENGMLL